ncbi:MAG: TonB family protein [Proteobacteria bacterium]|nr:TonB family protein [Pseudomonadota bacterium]
MTPQAQSANLDGFFPLRLAVGVMLGAVVTLSLFWIMQYLITSADRTLDTTKRGTLVDFVRIKRTETIQRRQIKPRKPPPPKTPPPQPPTPKLDRLKPTAEKIAIRAVPVQTDIELTSGGFSLGIGEGDYLPIVKVAPIYPHRALSRGIEGHCIVEFTVTRTGTTRDTRAVNGACDSAFKKASVAAATKFKYKPRVIDGQSVEVPGVRNKFTYKIED